MTEPETVNVAPAVASNVPPLPVPPFVFTCCGTFRSPPANRFTSPPNPNAPVDMAKSCFENVRSVVASRSRLPPAPPAAALASILPFRVSLPLSEIMVTSAPSPPLCMSVLLAAGEPVPSVSALTVRSPPDSSSTSP